MSDARIEIAYADHRDNRMIILGGAAWPTTAEQEWRFAELPEVENSDFIADFYDADGRIVKDKCVAAETVETVLGQPIEDLIEAGRCAEDDLTAQVRSRLSEPPMGSAAVENEPDDGSDHQNLKDS